MKLFILVWAMIGNAIAGVTTQESNLKIAMPFVPQKLSHYEINSLYEYILFDDLLRPLVKYDSSGELEADLAKSWAIKDDFKRFLFTLKDDQFFSDGTLITAEHAVNSFKKLIASPDIVHGDGTAIKEVLLVSKTQFEISLHHRNPFFLTELSAPEYRIAKDLTGNYASTSGAYMVERLIPSQKVELGLNRKFPESGEVKYHKITVDQYDSEKKLNDEFYKQYDLVWPKSSLTKKDIEDFQKNGFDFYQMNLGFSYWFSLNPQTLSKEEREAIYLSFSKYWEKKSFFADNSLEKAKQLFLPYGPGRLNESEIEAIVKSKKLNSQALKREFSVLLPRNIQKEIQESLTVLGSKVKIDYYNNFTEYAEIIKTSKHDLVFVNNDLSSLDLRSSLTVTFNKTRPLVKIQDGGEYEKILENIKKEQNNEVRYQEIKKIGKSVLEDSLVFPLYYSMGAVFAKKAIDLNGWNKAGAETYSWKIK